MVIGIGCRQILLGKIIENTQFAAILVVQAKIVVIRTTLDTGKVKYQSPVFLESHHLHKRLFRQVLLRKKVTRPGKGRHY